MRNPANRLYFENGVGRVEEDTAGFIRLVYYAGTRAAENWHGLLHHTKRLLTRQQSGLLLIDQRVMAPFSLVEQAWLVECWLPQAIVDGGYRYGAVVQAHDAFARLAMDTVRTQARNLQLLYRYFPAEEDAISWLLGPK